MIARAVDVTDSAAVKAFVDELASAWGGVDVLVNNAGRGRGGNLDTLTPELILAHAKVLQMGHFRFIQAVVPHMRRQHWGRIIEINALAGAIPAPDGIPSVINRASCIALAKGPMILYAHPERWATPDTAGLLAAGRERPGQLTFGYTSTTSRLPAEVLQQSTGIGLAGVPYKAGNQALPDLLEDRIDLLFTDLSAMVYVKQGKLRALAVADAQRSPLAPEVPTFAEAGIKGVELPYWVAAYAPARTPAAVLQRLHALIGKACQSSAVQRAFAVGGTTVFVTAPGELQRFQADEAAKWGGGDHSGGGDGRGVGSEGGCHRYQLGSLRRQSFALGEHILSAMNRHLGQQPDRASRVASLGRVVGRIAQPLAHRIHRADLLGIVVRDDPGSLKLSRLEQLRDG